MISMAPMMRAQPILGALPNPLRPAYSSLSFTTASASLNQTVTPTLQTVANGDLLVIAGMMRGDNGDGVMVVNTPGWTAFPGNTYGTGKIRFGMFWKIGTAAETGSTVSLTFTGTGANTLVRPRCVRFTAANGFHASPIGSINYLSGTVNPSDHQTITADGDNQLAVCFTGFSQFLSGSTVFGPWSGGSGVWTENNIGGSAAGGTGTMSVQTAPMNSGDSFDDDARSFSLEVAWTSVSFRVRPALV